MLTTRNPLQIERHTEAESKGIEKKIFPSNANEENVGVAILLSDKIEFKTKTIRDKEGHYIMIKGSNQ